MNDKNSEKKNSAIIKIRENKIEEAESILSEIRDPKSYFNAAIILEKMSKIDLAIKFYDSSIEIDPNYFPSFINKSKLIEKKGNITQAIQCLNDALKIKTNLQYITYYQLGNLYSKLLDYKKSLKLYIKSYKLNKDFLLSLHNIGNILEEFGKFRFSLKAYNLLINEATKRNILDDFPKTLLNKSLLLVKSGNYKDGLRDYEHRWLTPEFKNRKRNFGVETWKKNEDISGKTLLVFNEQGLGDTIYFFGCLNQLVEKNINVVFLIQKSLKDLFKNINKKITIISDEANLPKFDFSISLLSLPYYLDIDEKNILKIRYELAPEKSLVTNWSKIISKKKKNIGISWKGGIDNTKKTRSISLEKISQIFDQNQNLNFYCLHNEYDEEEKKKLNKYNNVFYYLGDEMNFSNTSALCCNLDLTITIDTSIAHISCATGIETWILLRKNPAFLFPFNKKKSLRYPTAKYFKQDRFNEWKSVIDKVSLSLKNL